MFYNWYDPATGEKLLTFPDSGDTVKPFLSWSTTAGWPPRCCSPPAPSLARQAGRRASART